MKRVISFALAVSIMIGGVPLNNNSQELRDLDLHFSFPEIAHAYNPDAGTKGKIPSVEIHNIEDLVKLATENSAQDYQYAEIRFYDSISANGDEVFSLGSTVYPFKGRIVVNQVINNAYSIVLARPLFEAISDSVEIVSSSGEQQELQFHRCLVKTTGEDGVTSQSTSGTPLFANHVYHDYDYGASPSQSWKFSAAPYTDEENEKAYCYPYSGLIGTVHKNARVNFEFINDTAGASNGNSNIVAQAGQGDVGLLSGKMEKIL